MLSSLFGILVACASGEDTSPEGALKHPGPHGAQAGGPEGPPLGGQAIKQSGGAVQDPSGFPSFHRKPPQPGPAPQGLGAFSAPVELSKKPGGGYRPQIAVGPKDQLHAVFYERAKAGDLIRYRQSQDGADWKAPEPLGFTSGRNWGPDLVARQQGGLALVFDKAEADFRSQGYLTQRSATGWSTPLALTPGGAREIGSGHVADATGEDLAYVYIGKDLGPQHRFRATGRWRVDGEWQDPVFFSDGTADAWHANVERRPDGSVLVGYDVGRGGSPTTLYIVEGRNGVFSEPENFSASSYPGERPHFAFGADGVDYVTWFHKERGFPLHIYVRSGRPGAWGKTTEPSKGLGGYHFDPEIEVNKDGVLCLVWGWDSGPADAEMLYSLNRGSGWEAAQKIADIDWGKPGLASIKADSTGVFHVVWNQGVRGENAVYYAALRP